MLRGVGGAARRASAVEGGAAHPAPCRRWRRCRAHRVALSPEEEPRPPRRAAARRGRAPGSGNGEGEKEREKEREARVEREREDGAERPREARFILVSGRPEGRGGSVGEEACGETERVREESRNPKILYLYLKGLAWACLGRDINRGRAF